MEYKDTLDQYKTCMEVALKKHPNLFIEYGISDAMVLYPIFQKTQKILRDTMHTGGEKIRGGVCIPPPIQILIFSCMPQGFMIVPVDRFWSKSTDRDIVQKVKNM